MRHLVENGLLPHETWIELIKLRFPQGKCPWHDVYDQDNLEKIVKSCGLDISPSLYDLRIEIVAAIERIFDFVDCFGAIATPTKKNNWRHTTISKIENLIRYLDGAQDFRPMPQFTPDFDSATDSLKYQLSAYVEYLRQIKPDPHLAIHHTIRVDFFNYVTDQLRSVACNVLPSDKHHCSIHMGGLNAPLPKFVMTAGNLFLENYFPQFIDEKSIEKFWHERLFTKRGPNAT